MADDELASTVQKAAGKKVGGKGEAGKEGEGGEEEEEEVGTRILGTLFYTAIISLQRRPSRFHQETFRTCSTMINIVHWHAHTANISRQLGSGETGGTPGWFAEGNMYDEALEKLLLWVL